MSLRGNWYILWDTFLTKHLQFSSTEILGKNNAYPIYDSILSTRLFNHKTAQPNHYEQFLETLQNLAKKNNCSVILVGKVLFDYFDRSTY